MKINGILYKKPCAIIHSLQNEDVPQFAELEDIIVIDNKPHFLVNLLTTENFNVHFNAFVIRKGGPKLLISPEYLISPFPVHVRKIEGLTSFAQRAIVIKYHLRQ